MPQDDLLCCLALQQHLKGLGVLAALGLPAKQSKNIQMQVQAGAHEEQSQVGCSGWQQCFPCLLAVTDPCFVLTLAPLLPTSPGRPRGPSGPGSPCENKRYSWSGMSPVLSMCMAVLLGARRHADVLRSGVSHLETASGQHVL